MQQNYGAIFSGPQDGADMLVDVCNILATELAGSCGAL